MYQGSHEKTPPIRRGWVQNLPNDPACLELAPIGAVFCFVLSASNVKKAKFTPPSRRSDVPESSLELACHPHHRYKACRFPSLGACAQIDSAIP